MMLLFLINDLVQASCATLILFAGKLWTSLVKYRSSVGRWTFLEPFTLYKVFVFALYSYLYLYFIKQLSRELVFSCSSQQILRIPPYSGMQEGKVSETDRNPEEHWGRCWGGFCWCCLLSWCWRWGLRWSSKARSRGFVAFLRPSVHPIRDEVNFTQFRMTWMSTLRQRSRMCRRSETPTWTILPFRMRLLSQVLWRKVRLKRDTNRLLVNTLFKVNTSKSDNIEEFDLQQFESHHIIC